MVEERWAELERAIAAEDLHRAIDICVAVTERERAELRDRLNAKFGLPTPLHWIACIPLGEAAMAAVTAVAEKPWLEFRYDEVHTRWQDIVAARRPAWREQWARLVIDVPWIDEMWLAYLDLRRAGVCEMTYDFDYVAARFGDVRRRINQSPQVDDELRDTVIWLAFDLGVPIDVSIVDGLVELAGRDELPRDRLLDAALTALGGDFEPKVTRTYARLHDALEPTAEESARRHDTYVGLLDHANPAAISFALAKLTALEAGSGTDGRAVIDRLGPALTHPARGQAKRASALLGRIAAREPRLAPEAMDHACDALTHEAGDVQAAAVKLLERHAGVLTTDTRERLADLTQHADPALRERLAALAGRSTPERRTRAAVTVPAPLPIDPATVPRLRVNAPLEPIADLDELLDLAFVLLETTGTPDDFERLVDGVARFRGHEIPAGRRKALDRAVGFRNQAMYGRVLQQRPTPVISLLVGLVEDGWGGYWVYRGPRAALDRRQAVVAACAGPRQLLSFPTHRGGFIDARVLAERLLVADDAYDDDLAQALLRLAPEGHAEALAALGEATGEGGAVLRAALGEAQERPAEPMFPASWDAVDVLTGAVPCEIEPRPESHSYWTDDRTRAPELSPVRLLALSERQYDVGRELGRLRWLALVRPGDREIYYAAALRELLHDGTDHHGEKDPAYRALEPLLDPDEPLGPSALAFLAWALGGLAPARALASDIVVEAIRTRRLVPAELGAAIAHTILADDAVPERWAEPLAAAALAGPLHEHELQQTVEAILGALGPERPRGLTGLVDLLRRLGQEADARISDPGARAWLEACAPRSKTGMLARAALAVAGDGAARSVEAAAAAEEGRRERALRWGA